MKELIIITLISNLLFILMFCLILGCIFKGESSKRKQSNRQNYELRESLRQAGDDLTNYLNSKLIKLKDQTFNIRSIYFNSNGGILVDLVDMLGFSKMVDIKDLTITEKEI